MISEASWSAAPPRRRAERERAVARLGSLAALSPAEQATLVNLIGPVELLPPGQDIVRESPPLARAGLILSGWACRQRMLPDGRRQILGLLAPGDFVGLVPNGPLGESWTVCLTRVELAGGEALRRRLAEAKPVDGRIAAAFAALARVEQQRLLDQIVRLGRQTAYERVGHLLLELHQRAEGDGPTASRRFALPLTQEVLADVVGLSVVHVNRVLQQMKRERLLELHAGQAALLNAPLLAEICDFTSPADAACGRGRRETT